MSSTEEKASGGQSSNLNAGPIAQSSTGKRDERVKQTQHTKSGYKSEGERIKDEGESANSDPIRGPAHPTKLKSSDSETLSAQAATLSDTQAEEQPRQVIAVSASKGPAAFFNLARKFLVTDEMCDLSALEGAIVSAVDAAHLLERSQLATIVRVHTSYVTVEPKRKKHVIQTHTLNEENLKSAPDIPKVSDTLTAHPAEIGASEETAGPTQAPSSEDAAGPTQAKDTAPQQPQIQSSQRNTSGGRELRRARIVITVKRTESYKQWLLENPLQAIIADVSDDDADVEETPSPLKASAKSAETPT